MKKITASFIAAILTVAAFTGCSTIDWSKLGGIFNTVPSLTNEFPIVDAPITNDVPIVSDPM